MAREQLGPAPSGDDDAVRKQDLPPDFVVTAVKTAAYTAARAELVRCDATDGGFTVTLPSAPQEGSPVVVKKIDSTINTILVQRSGTDTFNTDPGPTLLELSTPGETVALEYLSGIWHVMGHGFTKPGLDERYVRQARGALPAWFTILDSNGANALGITAEDGAANYWLMKNSAPGSPLKLQALGTDTNCGLQFLARGSGVISFHNNSGEFMGALTGPANAVNFPQLTSSTTGNAVTVSAQGNDSNVSINLAPKGTGKVKVNNVNVALQGELVHSVKDYGAAARRSPARRCAAAPARQG